MNNFAFMRLRHHYIAHFKIASLTSENSEALVGKQHNAYGIRVFLGSLYRKSGIDSGKRSEASNKGNTHLLRRVYRCLLYLKNESKE